jgi:hypothetical protein
MGGIIGRRLCLSVRGDAASRWGDGPARRRSDHDCWGHDGRTAIVGTIKAVPAQTIPESEAKTEAGGCQSRAVETIRIIGPIETVGSVKAGPIGSVKSIAVVRLVEPAVMIATVTAAGSVSVGRR